jgi:hypothetical protein
VLEFSSIDSHLIKDRKVCCNKGVVQNTLQSPSKNYIKSFVEGLPYILVPIELHSKKKQEYRRR